jgi:hypothetical protein
MLKRALRVILPLLLLSSPAFAVGTIPLSMTQQLDGFGVPLAGCLLYTIQAGTTSTPQNAYQDTGLTLPQPNPMVCDGNGRLPQFFLADGQIKIRLTDRLGNPQTVIDNILVIGPSSGGGGGGTIDPTTIAATGDIKTVYGTQVITGWVRFNGRTIGSATSGATERANADTQALFQYLWSADANLVVSSGRGVSSAADWAANKTITLPDGRERVLAGLGDMGNADAARLTSAKFGCSPIVLGCAGGAETRTFVTANLPPYTPAGTNSAQTITTLIGGSTSPQGVIFGSGAISEGTGGSSVYPTGAFGTISAIITVPTFAGTAQGGTSTPFSTTGPTLLVTIYIKL